jgi:hypothetical protein
MRTRSLRFERLDARQFLAADTATLQLDDNEQVAPSDVGQATAISLVTADSPLWGDEKGSDFSALQNDGYGYGELPPSIINFSGTPGSGGMWTFTGQVIDDLSVQGLTVTFGGLLAGHTVNVGSNGTFTHDASIPPGTTGVVSATVTDRNGLTSQPVYWYVG